MENNSLAQELNSSKEVSDIEVKVPHLKKLCELASREGIILLKNQNTLPLSLDEEVSYFGRCTYDYFCVGYGSGGDVITPYRHSLYDGLVNINANINQDLNSNYLDWVKNNKVIIPQIWGAWPMSFPEYDIDEQIVCEASKTSNVAVVTIGRSAGEDKEFTLTKGSYYLTDLELSLIKKVNKYFKKTIIVVDSGNIIDFSFLNDIICDALLFAYHGGMSAGDSLAKIIYGIYTPCAKLTSTIAKKYEYYPSSNDFGHKEYNNYTEDIYVGYRYFETFDKDKVLFPFGYGLSYTKFNYDINTFEHYENKLYISVIVKNVGDYNGKETIQIYLETPSKEVKRSLVGFNKTRTLKPNEQENLEIYVDLLDHLKYDEINEYYYLESGIYNVYIGEDVSNCDITLQFELKDKYIKKSKSIMQVRDPFKVLTINGYKDVIVNNNNLKDDVLNDIPELITPNYDKTKTLDDVRDNKITLDEFIASLSIDELDSLSHGEGEMNSSLGVSGNAGSFGGVTESLRNRKISPVITCDGPSGARCSYPVCLLPCATALASSFNVSLIENLYHHVAMEMKEYDIDVLLAPGMNIQRNPLCGRNFEYYSEDPYLSGIIAASAIRGIQSLNGCACPKHFALNNQEYNRSYNDSRVSEKALREIYLRNFEVMLKHSKPKVIMTSYNKINSIYAHYNYHLVKSYLRDELGYDSLVITDWWLKPQRSSEFSEIVDDAYRIRACVDVAMPGYVGKGWDGKDFIEGRNIAKSLDYPNGLKLSELQRVAKYILTFILKNKPRINS